MTENTTAVNTENVAAPELANDVQRIIVKVGAQLDGESSHAALSALICMVSGAITGPSLFDGDQKKAAALFLLSTAVQVSIEAGLSDTDITSAMVQPEFYGDNPAEMPTPQIIL